MCAPIRAEEGLLGALCPPGSNTPYNSLSENESIGGYPTYAQIDDLHVDAKTLDSEGRCVVLEFPAFVLFGVYVPANSNDSEQGKLFREAFFDALDIRIRNLHRMGKNVILTGDLNVIREEIDTARAEESIREAGGREEWLSRRNQRIFNQLIEHGKVVGEPDEGRENPVFWDICREFHPKRKGMYTHWDTKINARPGNYGSRIDYILCSIEMKSWFIESNIQEGLMGSDHCPVYAQTKDVVDWRGKQAHIVDILNPPGVFKDGKRLRELDPAKDIPRTSGKLMPEFHKRRSIKDMFSKKPTLSTAKSTVFIESESLKPIEETATASKLASTPPRTSKLTNSPNKPVNSFNAAEKRRSSTTSPAKPVKRSKSNGSTSNSQGSAKGQQSLKGFFISKTPGPKSQSAPEPSPIDSPPTQEEAEPSQTPTPSIPTEPIALEVIDPEKSIEGWTKLFSMKPLPRCEHNEECKKYSTKKKGPNCGREFFLCAR